MSVQQILEFVSDYCETHRRTALIAAGSVFVILIVLIIILATGQNEVPREKVKTPIPLESLYIPDEPGKLPDVVPLRERKSKWTEDDLQQWFKEPDAADLERMQQLYTSEIDSLMEKVP